MSDLWSDTYPYQRVVGGNVVRSSELWGGLFWLALGAYVTWAGRDLGLGKINDPGPGFAFFWIGLLILAFSASIVAGAFRKPGASLGSLWRDTRWAKVLTVIGLLVAYGFLFETVGFILCSIALLLILMFAIDPVRPIIAIPLAILMPSGVWYVVTKTLKIQMPAGLLAGWVG